jgi:hypothetical protein
VLSDCRLARLEIVLDVLARRVFRLPLEHLAKHPPDPRGTLAKELQKIEGFFVPLLIAHESGELQSRIVERRLSMSQGAPEAARLLSAG